MREDIEQGDGNPMMQLAAYYSQLVSEYWTTDGVQQTCCPAFGLEVVGNLLRYYSSMQA